MSEMPKAGDTMIAVASSLCPRCGGEVGIATDINGRQCILHIKPQCATFIELDADAFAALCGFQPLSRGN